MFAFQDGAAKPVYWIYNYKRGACYPFVPAGGEQQRDTERELRLKAQIGAELPDRAASSSAGSRSGRSRSSQTPLRVSTTRKRLPWR